jgi:hypothetical protein
MEAGDRMSSELDLKGLTIISKPLPIIITGLPVLPSLNKYGRGNHWAYTNAKKEYEAKCRWRFMELGYLGGNAFDFKIHCYIDIYFKDKRTRDDDNFAPKFLKDAMIGYFVADDSPDYMSWELRNFNKLKDRENPRTDLEIVRYEER